MQESSVLGPKESEILEQQVQIEGQYIAHLTAEQYGAVHERLGGRVNGLCSVIPIRGELRFLIVDYFQ